MEFIIASLIFVGGYVYSLKLFLNHIDKLEIRVKAKDLSDLKYFETEYKETKPVDEPESLTELFQDKQPNEIRASFNRGF